MPTIKRTPDEEAEVQARGPEYLETLARGLRVIDAFNVARGPQSLSQIARLAGLPRATARRTLMTLEAIGYVVLSDKTYTLTPKVLTLASAYLASNQVTTILQLILDRISDRAREVCSLSILDGSHVVFIGRASPARVFTTGLEIGYRLPAYCSSVGRVLLGAFSDERLDVFLSSLSIEAATPHTIVDKSILKSRIIADRQQDYSLVDQEAELGFRSIAVPVRRQDGSTIAAMNLGAHVDRVSIGRLIDDFLPLLREGAGEARPMLV